MKTDIINLLLTWKGNRINSEIHYRGIHPWKSGTELVIEATDNCLCIACCWLCLLKAWDAAGPICNTLRCKGLLVYCVQDYWCRHNPSLDQTPVLFSFYVKDRNTCTGYNVISLCRLCNSKKHKHGNWWAYEDQSKIMTCYVVHSVRQLFGSALTYFLLFFPSCWNSFLSLNLF